VKIVFAGDAVHPLAPASFQAGTQAVEDGATIALCLALSGATQDRVPLALKVYERLRSHRAEKAGELGRKVSLASLPSRPLFSADILRIEFNSNKKYCTLSSLATSLRIQIFAKPTRLKRFDLSTLNSSTLTQKPSQLRTLSFSRKRSQSRKRRNRLRKELSLLVISLKPFKLSSGVYYRSLYTLLYAS
jgi:hypothetical protein